MLLQGHLQALLAFAMYLTFVLVGLRIARKVEPAILVVLLAVANCAVSLPLLALSGLQFNLWVFMVVYWFLVTSFLMVFGALYKSLSLRILRDMLSKPGRADSYEEIFSRYLVEESYKNRLDVICRQRFVNLVDNRYLLTPRGMRLARRVFTVQQWFGISRSG